MSTTPDRTSPQKEAPRAALVLALACGATFLTFLDTTVVNVAFPAIQQSMPSASFAHLSWIVTSYTTLFAALLTTAGRYADVIGHRRMFVVAVAVFTLSSAVCAAAVNLPMLIAARAVQGIGAAALIPSALGLLLVGTPAEQRAAAIGKWGAAGAVAAVIGPFIGGALTDWVDWRMIFAINLPIGAAMLHGAIRKLPATPWPRRGPLPDAVGGVLIACGIGALVVGLSQAGDWGVTSAGVLTSVIGGLVLTACGILRSRGRQSPAIELGLFRISAFTLSNIVVASFSAAMYIILLSSPLYLTAMWNYTLLEAALAVTPGAFASIVVSLHLGKRATPSAQRVAAIGGSLGLAATAGLMYLLLNDNQSFAVWVPFSLGGGIAAGLIFTSMSVAMSTSVPPTHFAAGSGLLTTSRQVGGSIGIAVMAAMLSGARAGHPESIRDVWLFAFAVALLAAVPAAFLYREKPTRAQRAQRD
jgi:EmrB/QacA subfamily drug resistance transporter